MAKSNPFADAIAAWEAWFESLENLQYILTGDRTRHDPEGDAILELVGEAARAVQGMAGPIRTAYLIKLWSRFEKDYREKAKEPGRRFEDFKLRKQIEAAEREMATPEWREERKRQLLVLRAQVDEKLREYDDA